MLQTLQPLSQLSRLTHAASRRESGNDIGVPGQPGFGVGTCPILPAGYSKLAGTDDPASPNYGNYQYSDGSVMCWIPQCWFRYDAAGDVDDVQPSARFASESSANAAGYASHRADWDGGYLQRGFMVDKYLCSANGGVASSIANAAPMVATPSAGQVGFAAVGAAAALYGAIGAAKTRGAAFFPKSRFMTAKLAALARVHARRATGETYCAWYDATGVANFPRGCNNNNLRDYNDSAVLYTSSGASSQPNMPLTGSGAPFAKTTHNGQACGVADLNGTLWEVDLGVTALATAKAVSGATAATPVVITCVGHGFETGDIVMLSALGGMTQLNDRLYRITAIGPNTFSLDGCAGGSFSAYTSGGTATRARWYASAKTATMAAYTAGASLSTDHWGAAGVAATMEGIEPGFRLDYPGNGLVQRFGNGAAGLFRGALSGADWLLDGAGFPRAEAISSSGANVWGADYWYQYGRDLLCVRSGGDWGSAAFAGVWAADLLSSRAGAVTTVGVRAASFPVPPSGSDGG